MERGDGREATLVSSVALGHPAATVAGILLDWGHDDLWRPAVEQVECTPRGRAVEGQRLVEHLRFAGLSFTTPSVVDSAGVLGATYDGGSERVSVRGTRVVVPGPDGGCVVHVVTRLRVHGWLRLLAPVLVPAYRRTQDADLRRLAWWVETLHGPAPTAVPAPSAA